MCADKRGAHWNLTVKANQPRLHAQLAGLPWRAVPDAARDTDLDHGRREIRTWKILTVAAGIDFPHAAQAVQIRRRRRRLDQPNHFTTETVYAITDLRVYQARPTHLASWIRGHRSTRTRSTGSEPSPTTTTDPRSVPAPNPKSWLPYASPWPGSSATAASSMGPHTALRRVADGSWSHVILDSELFDCERLTEAPCR